MLPTSVVVIGNEIYISAPRRNSACSGFHFFAPPALHVAAKPQDQSRSAHYIGVHIGVDAKRFRYDFSLPVMY
jgi:hypothetical protein